MNTPIEEEDFEMFDPIVAGILILGLSVGQISRLKLYYQDRTGDMDFERLEEFTKGLK